MILAVHVQGAPSYDIGDELWQASLADAVRAEAEIIAGYAGPELPPISRSGAPRCAARTDRRRHDHSAGAGGR